MREVIVAEAPQKRVVITCVDSREAWEIAYELGPRLEAQMETFVAELTVFLVMGADRVSYPGSLLFEARIGPARGHVRIET